MKERQGITDPPKGEPLQTSIAEEEQILADERTFFKRIYSGSRRVEGLLTTRDITTVTRLYPKIIQGILTVYAQKSSPIQTSASVEKKLYQEYLAAMAKKGELIPNENAYVIREDISSGKYSEQAGAILNVDFEGQEESGMDYDDADDDIDNEDYQRASYDPALNPRATIRNKMLILSQWHGLQTDLKNLYGSANFQGGLLVDLILAAPFLDEVVSRNVGNDSSEKHQQYLEEILKFSQRFDPDERIKAYDLSTSEYPISPAVSFYPRRIEGMDLVYAARLYDFAKAMQNGSYRLEDLYEILQDTLLKRGRIFQYDFSVQGRGIMPSQVETLTFNDIIGHGYASQYFQTLIERLVERSPALANIRMILIEGRPGIGKSAMIKAFLNSLPDNSKGIVFNYDPKEGNMPRYRQMTNLARLYPNEELFFVIEDIDAEKAARDLLGIEAVSPDETPPNLHLIITTTNTKLMVKALFRPGRISKRLVLQELGKTDRANLVRTRMVSLGLEFPEKVIKKIAGATSRFSPDEIIGVLKELQINGRKNPSRSHLRRIIREIRELQKLGTK